MSVLRSNLWPVAAYMACAVWLLSSFLMDHPTWLKLVPLNGLVHYTVTLSFSVVGSEWMGRRKTMALVLGLMVGWELFELWWFGTLLGNRLEDTRVFEYWVDMSSDFALGSAGMLTGAYLADEGSNTSDA